jgi:K(+)-stimulated pyrophosphate-energized sodium pump
MVSSLPLIFAFAVGLCASLVLGWLLLWIRRGHIRSPRIAELTKHIATGAHTYLARQLRTISWVTAIVTVAILFFAGWKTAITFALGVSTSLLTSWLGMSSAVRANGLVADRAKGSITSAFRTAFLGGSIMGLAITSFSLLILTLLYSLFREATPLVGFGFGASLAALFAQIGGGIYTKSADVGADLVGKVERGIPEDDPRNPAVIADLVGDNVGDCAGRGADLFQSFSSDIVTGLIMGTALIPRYGPRVVFFPLVLQALGIVSSMTAITVVSRPWKNLSPSRIFAVGILTNTLVNICGAYFVARWVGDLSIFAAICAGVAVMLLASFTTRHYAGMQGRPVHEIAEASHRGASINIITGLSYGLRSPLPSIAGIMIAIPLVYWLSGRSPLSLVAINIGTDLMIAYVMAADAFGPITDNAAGIAQMSHQSESVVAGLAGLDAVGNTMKAITKAYADASGTLTTFIIFATFSRVTGVQIVDISEPLILALMFIGVCLPFLASSLVIGATSQGAQLIVDEVRRQFHQTEGLVSGHVEPDYALVIDIATRNALKKMVLPGLVGIVPPIAVGLILGVEPLGGMLLGALAASALLGPFFNNAGTAWDNAKKLVEQEGPQILGTPVHEAAVLGDTVGDPLKDVAGPSTLILMKLIGMTTLLLVEFLN